MCVVVRLINGQKINAPVGEKGNKWKTCIRLLSRHDQHQQFFGVTSLFATVASNRKVDNEMLTRSDSNLGDVPGASEEKNVEKYFGPQMDRCPKTLSETAQDPSPNRAGPVPF